MRDSIDRDYQPDFDAGEKSRAAEPRHQVARELARALHKRYRVSAPPVDVEHLVKDRGLMIVKVSVQSRLSGALYANKREIVVNTHDRSPERQRFTIAHELGHWELRHHEQGELPEDTMGYAGPLDGGGAPEPRSAVEIEANTFAAELLMPGTWIRRLKKPISEGTPRRLAGEYQVSVEAMFYQLMHCGRF